MLEVTAERFALREVFTISRGSKTHADVLTVRVSRDGGVGQGECVPYARYGETLESVSGQIRALASDISRTELQAALPAGAARNAVDCALWDLEAKVAGRRAWDLAGVAAPSRVISAYTLSLGTPEAMEAQARREANRPLLKTKLGGDGDVARIEAVRRGAPDARIIVDANEGWTPEVYRELAPVLVRLGVEMVEQPFPAGEDGALAELARVLPVCADESCHDRGSLAELKGLYDIVNIKLDKTGGLTEALALRREALSEGFGVMVGCMVGTSLAMAPALLLADGAEFVDLDGPLLLAEDREPPLVFEGSAVLPPDPGLWG
ncbi:N-acetyl-D-Glu racemase DgcA [Algicella marina]|uniref:Dipeptide epimerase n=1 Tax=Algicella marina TaxID=2683284 RepID=A0A6P1SW53_9RHOB|nr:N-acetyl-D-Glu racemase DgcA [Algicella marina]QHQ33765.1 dipeptide epimerase [Algicella marina]